MKWILQLDTSVGSLGTGDENIRIEAWKAQFGAGKP